MSEISSDRVTKLAERFLRESRDARQQISLYLSNGFQLKGLVVDYDDEAILFNHKGVHQLVMRSGVSSMYPLRGSRQDANDWWRDYAPAAEAE